jgi:histidine triad (HIT) family protein
MSCIFCRIARREVESTVVYEDDRVIAFDDVAPQAKVHVLVCPKEHVTSLAHLRDDQEPLAASLLLAVRRVAERKQIANSGYRLISNVGEHGGQEVLHLHLHVVGGQPVGRMLAARGGLG